MKTARDRLRFQRLIAMVVTASCVPGVAPGETIALIPGATVHLAPGVAIELVPGVPIERDLAGGETHEYQLTLTAGQYAHAVADQLGIDLQLAVFAPDGKTLISINNVADTVGPEPVSILAETGGVYRLEVSLKVAAHYFAPSHRVRVYLTSSDFPMYDRNLNTGGDNVSETTWVKALNVIHQGGRYPSALVLPVVP